MATSGTHEYPSDHSGPESSGGPIKPLRWADLTDEERNILKECNSTSFWMYSVPIGAVLTIGTSYGIRTGYFKPRNRFVQAAYYGVSMFAGLSAGRLLYSSTCMRMIEERCPDGVIAAKRRNNRQIAEDRKAGRGQLGLGSKQSQEQDHGSSHMAYSPDAREPPVQPVSDERGDELPSKPQVFSYADARNDNRSSSNGMWNRAPSYQQPPQPTADRPQSTFFADEPRSPREPKTREQPPPSSFDESPQPRKGRKNEYGDEWAE